MPEEPVLIAGWASDLDMEPDFFASPNGEYLIFIIIEIVLYQVR
jgi:hypothetical protein